MAAGEDQAESIVFDALVIRPRGRIDEHRLRFLAHVVERIEASPSACRVNRLEATSRYEPRAGVGRHTVARPLLEGRSKCVVQRFLGGVKVAEQSNQRREHAPRFRLIDRCDRFLDRTGGVHQSRSLPRRPPPSALGGYEDCSAQLTIQGIPNWSCVMPKPGDQNVFWKGISIFPPADSSLKMRSASAYVFGWTDTYMPCGASYRSGGASDPISVSPSTFRATCMTRP